MSRHFNSREHYVWLPYHLAVGPVFKRWFDGLKEGKILGNRCPKCRKILVPPRSFCPECNVAIDEWEEVSQEGRVVTWTIANKSFIGAPSHPPYACALIRLDGTDCDFLHVLGGPGVMEEGDTPSRISSGCRVKAEWSEERKGHLLDIKYFRLAAS